MMAEAPATAEPPPMRFQLEVPPSGPIAQRRRVSTRRTPSSPPPVASTSQRPQRRASAAVRPYSDD